MGIIKEEERGDISPSRSVLRPPKFDVSNRPINLSNWNKEKGIYECVISWNSKLYDCNSWIRQKIERRRYTPFGRYRNSLSNTNTYTALLDVLSKQTCIFLKQASLFSDTPIFLLKKRFFSYIFKVFPAYNSSAK